MIPYGRQSIDQDDIDAVVKVLGSDWLTQGPEVDRFEAALCEVTEAGHAVAFSSGTAALHAAAAVAGLGPGDVVHTSPLTFVGTASAMRHVGARVEFVDIDEPTWNIDLDLVPSGTAAAVPVHFAGLPVEMDRLDPRPAVVIEDAAHALGASTPWGPVGNCAHSDMCCFSFHPVKTVTTGEGGAVTTNSSVLADALRVFRHHGIRPTPEVAPWAYDVVHPGYNYRLTDIQSALGVSQLAKLGSFVERRNELADRYRTLLADDPVVLPPRAAPGYLHAHHLFPVVLEKRHRAYIRMREQGILVQVHYQPVYQMTAFAVPDAATKFPVTEAVTSGLLSLPLHPGLTERDQDTVVEHLRRSL